MILDSAVLDRVISFIDVLGFTSWISAMSGQRIE